MLSCLVLWWIDREQPCCHIAVPLFLAPGCDVSLMNTTVLVYEMLDGLGRCTQAASVLGQE